MDGSSLCATLELFYIRGVGIYRGLWLGRDLAMVESAKVHRGCQGLVTHCIRYLKIRVQ